MTIAEAPTPSGSCRFGLRCRGEPGRFRPPRAALHTPNFKTPVLGVKPPFYGTFTGGLDASGRVFFVGGRVKGDGAGVTPAAGFLGFVLRSPA